MHIFKDIFEHIFEDIFNYIFERVFELDFWLKFEPSILVHYDTCALSSTLLHGVKLGPERSEGPITPCNGLLKTLVSYNIL